MIAKRLKRTLSSLSGCDLKIFLSMLQTSKFSITSFALTSFTCSSVNKNLSNPFLVKCGYARF